MDVSHTISCREVTCDCGLHIRFYGIGPDPNWENSNGKECPNCTKKIYPYVKTVDFNGC